MCSTNSLGAYITYPKIAEDFVANYGKVDYTQYKFYGICVSACPGALSVTCNYASTSDDAKTAATLVAAATAPAALRNVQGCITSGSTASGSTSVTVGAASASCAQIQKNCWINPAPTAPVLFRCIPVYNTTATSAGVCSYPEGVSSPDDPRCLLKTTTATGTTVQPAKTNALFDQLNSTRSLWGRYFGDLARAWWVILVCAVGFSIITGFTFVTFLKYFTGCMVWTIIALSVGLTAFLTAFFYYKAGLIPLSASQSAAVAAATTSVAGGISVPYSVSLSGTGAGSDYAIIAYVATAVLLVMLCIVVATMSSINTAIEVIKLGTDALRATPSLVFFPCTNVITMGLFLVWWLFVAACLASAGDITTSSVTGDLAAGAAKYNAAIAANPLLSGLGLAIANSTSATANATLASFSSSSIANYLLIYHFFGLLWTVNFIAGISTVTVAGAVGAWYFSCMPADVEADPKMAALKYDRGRCSVLAALWRTVRFHVGSVAAGSLLISIVSFIQVVVAYVTYRLKAAAEKNSALKFLLCCANCCLMCLKVCIEVITRNSYIYVAIKGEGFLSSGRRVFGLVMAHGSVFAVVNVLGELIMLLGKVLIAVVSAFAAYLIIEQTKDFQAGGAQAITSSWLPILVTLFFAYFIGSGFMSIFDLAVDTVLVCYVTDIDENLARNGGNAAHAVPIHMKADKLDIKGRVAKQEAMDADAAGRGAGKGPLSSTAGGV